MSALERVMALEQRIVGLLHTAKEAIALLAPAATTEPDSAAFELLAQRVMDGIQDVQFEFRRAVRELLSNGVLLPRASSTSTVNNPDSLCNQQYNMLTGHSNQFQTFLPYGASLSGLSKDAELLEQIAALLTSAESAQALQLDLDVPIDSADSAALAVL